MHEDPAPTPEEQEDAPEDLPEHQSMSGPGHEDDDLPGDEPTDGP